MARLKRINETENVSKAVNPQDQPERFRLSELGYNGVPIFNGVSTEEIKRELNHPNSIKTYKQMSMHPAINSALNLYLSMVAKATLRVNTPKEATEDDKQKQKILTEMLSDMDHSVDDFMTEAMSMSVHGFAVVEKVYRRRYKANGSMYDDGVIAPKKLKLRSQESIEKFIFDESGNDVIGVKQNISGISDPYGRYLGRKELEVVLPRNKFMLFNVGRNRSNPYGTSPLRDVYLPWRYLTTIEELEAAGVHKDLAGLPLLRIPAQYMSADASPEQKAIYENFKNIIRNMQQGQQSGVILPSAVDPDTRKELFNLELLSKEGTGKSFDTEKIKEYYRGMIFIGMSADLLLMGNTNTGSFALGTLKNTLTGNTVENYLKRIVQTLNDDLVKQIYELNGWDVTRRCTIDYEGFEDVDLEGFSKAVQRMASVGMLPQTIDVINAVLSSVGVDKLPEDTNLEDILPDKTSRAGDGMAKGSGNGTSDSVAGTDTSSMNADNAA